jgi:hypothetical protein
MTRDKDTYDPNRPYPSEAFDEASPLGRDPDDEAARKRELQRLRDEAAGFSDFDKWQDPAFAALKDKYKELENPPGGEQISGLMDEYAALRSGVLGTDSNRDTELLGARNNIADTRRQQLEVMEMMRARQNEPAIAGYEAAAQRGALNRQVGAAGSDLQAQRAALMGLQQAGGDIATQGSTNTANERLRALQQSGGMAGNVRGRDLSQVAMEQKVLMDNMKWAATKENLANQYLAMGLNARQAMENAQIDLELMQAGVTNFNRGNDFDFKTLIPGLTNMAAAGVGALAGGAGSSGYDAQADLQNSINIGGTTGTYPAAGGFSSQQMPTSFGL